MSQSYSNPKLGRFLRHGVELNLCNQARKSQGGCYGKSSVLMQGMMILATCSNVIETGP